MVSEALSCVAAGDLAGDCDRLVMMERLRLRLGEFVVSEAARCVGVFISADESVVNRRG